jgi:hypothetical protein
LKKILPFFSYLFHPLFISVYATLFYFILFHDFYIIQEIYLFFIQIVIITVLIPISLFYLLLSFEKIDNIMAEKLSQRKIPLLINCILLFILTQKSITAEKIPELHYFFVGALFSSILAFLLLLLKKKASLHMIGIVALTFFIIGVSQRIEISLLVTIATFIVLIGIVGSSRLVMKAHTLTELTIGFFCGALPQVFFWPLWL